MSSSQTQQTEFAEATPEEKELFSAGMAMMPYYADSLGIEMTKRETALEDDATYKQKQQKTDSIAAELANLDSKINSGQLSIGDQAIWNQRRNLQAQLNNANDDLTKYSSEYEPTIEWDVQEKPPTPELERIAAASGRDSAEYQSVYAEYQAGQEADYAKQQDIYRQSMDNTMKYLQGDFSLNESQKQFISDTFAPIATAAETLFTNITSEAEKTETNLKDAYEKYTTEFEDRVKQTGLDTLSALTAIGEQIQATGASMEAGLAGREAKGAADLAAMETSLTSLIDSRQKIMEMGIEDTTGELTKKVAAQAAQLGRDSSDPEYQKEIQETVSREISRGNLELGGLEAQGQMGIGQERLRLGQDIGQERTRIAERTGTGLENVAQQRAMLAESQGQRLEQSSLGKQQFYTGLAERTGSLREAAQQQRGGQLYDIAGQKASTGYNIATGFMPASIGAGINIGQYNQALQQQRAANYGMAMGAPMSFRDRLYAERAAQPTTTMTKNYGFGDFMGDVAGVGGGIAAGASGLGWKPFS